MGGRAQGYRWTRRGARPVVASALVVIALASPMACGSSKHADSATTTSSAPAAAGSGAPDAQSSDRFWTTIAGLDALASTTPGRDKAAALGQQVCAAINPAMTVPQAQAAATSVLNTAGVRPAAVPFWAGAASAAFCPEYSKLLTGS